MTLYNVHIYREMRLFYPGIEAATPEQAARVAEAKPTADAEYSEDCDGESLSALVDVVGDDEFSQSAVIDFDGEQTRKAASALRDALVCLVVVAEGLDAALDGTTSEFNEERRQLDAACRAARDVLTTGERLDLHTLFASRRQVAIIWSTEDVQTVRPNLTDDEAWIVLQRCEKIHDCEVGFNWLLIETVADELFPEPAATEE